MSQPLSFTKFWINNKESIKDKSFLLGKESWEVAVVDYQEYLTEQKKGKVMNKILFKRHTNGTVGKYMTVKYFNMTPDGVPFLPVALQIREDI